MLRRPYRVLLLRTHARVYGAFHPPPSPTFAVSPGGTLIMAREPWIAKAHADPSLEKWRMRSRLAVATLVAPGKPTMRIVAAYGYPESHHSRGANDDMLADIVMSVASQTCPSMLAGDLNVSLQASKSLSLAPTFGVHPISPTEETTTMKKNMEPARGHAIDLVMGNLAMCGLVSKTYVDRKTLVSDHFPVIVHLRNVPASFDVVGWPKKVSSLSRPSALLPFSLSPTSLPTFKQWQVEATRWIAGTFGVKVPSKSRVLIKKYRPAAPTKA